MIAEDSPLRHPPANLSRKQVVILDGIRYAADMAEIAYERLAKHLQFIAALDREPTVKEIATGFIDAWSIVDSAHRFRDLITNLPGLKKNAPWVKVFEKRTDDVAELRDCVQHQLGEVDELIAGSGQLWGYLSWVRLDNGKPTPNWQMMSAGSTHVQDQWLFMGPVTLPFPVPIDRIRLNAFGRQVYLARTVRAVHDAVRQLEGQLAANQIKGVGEPDHERRGADAVIEGAIEVMYTVEPRNPKPPGA